MASLAEDISDEKDYLSRSARFPKLSYTSVTYILKSHYNNESMDGSEETLKKSLSVLALLAPL